jgi:heme-degrading monooxygenase HmoA
MTAVVTMVSARIPPDRVPRLVAAFGEAARAGFPDQRRQTSLLRGEGGTWRIVTLWSSREDLAHYLSSGEEPFARRLLREAGGAPEVEVFEVVVDSGITWWP